MQWGGKWVVGKRRKTGQQEPRNLGFETQKMFAAQARTSKPNNEINMGAWINMLRQNEARNNVTTSDPSG